MTAEELADFPVVTSIDVAWGDLDAMGHVNNARFFRYFESARINYFAALGISDITVTPGAGPILAETGCRFRRPLGFPDRIEVGARVSEIGEDRFRMSYRIVSTAQQDVVAEGFGVVVSYDYNLARKTALPRALREGILATEGGEVPAMLPRVDRSAG